MSSDPSPTQALAKNRGWLIAGGLLSIFIGLSAMGSPLLFSLALAEFLGAFILASGVISICLALFGKHVTHRVLGVVLALIRIAAGVIMLMYTTSSVAVITFILAVFLTVEGVSLIAAAISLRAQSGWVWTLVSGIAAIVLGMMVFAKWPGDSIVYLGLFFGINALFSGISLLTFGLAVRPQGAAPDAAGGKA